MNDVICLAKKKFKALNGLITIIRYFLRIINIYSILLLYELQILS